MKPWILPAALTLVAVLPAAAQAAGLRLPLLYSHGAVVQRDRPRPVS